MKPTSTKNFVIISPDEDEDEIKRKLNSDAEYIVSLNSKNNTIRVQTREVALQMYQKMKKLELFHKLFAVRAASADPFISMAQASDSSADVFAIMKNNSLTRIGFKSPLPSIRNTKVGGGLGKRATAAPPKKPVSPKRQVKKNELSKGTPEPFYLNAKYPKEVKLEAPFEIEVSLTEIAEAEAHMPFIIDIIRNSRVDVFLQPVKGFEMKGRQDAQLVAGGLPAQTRHKFQVIPTEQGKGTIKIYALQGGKFLGQMEISITISQHTVVKKIKEENAGLKTPDGELPDLQLLIFEQQPRDNEIYIQFRISVNTPAFKLELQDFGTTRLRMAPYAVMNDLFKEIEELNMTVFQDKKKAVSKLQRFGAYLYETLIPQELKTMLWKLHDKIKTISIISDEPYIPWEICRITHKENRKTQELGFMGELYEITRWMPGVPSVVSPLNLSKWGLIIPQDSNLTHAKNEKKALQKICSTNNFKCHDIPPNFHDVLKNLEAGKISVWHFTGHGSYQDMENPDQSTIFLANKDPFKPNYISGSVTNLGLSSPVVFLNACQAGRSGMSLTGIGGWATRFIRSGASVFIGAYWSILDDAAYSFSQAFYHNLIKKKMSVGQSVLYARRKVKELGDPTWLAYTVYAHPYSKMK